MRKRLLMAGALLAGQAMAQVSGAGQLGCQTAPVAGAAWSSATSLNTTQILITNAPVGQVGITLDTTTTITAGAVTFLGDYGDGNFVTVPASQIIAPGTFASIGNPYTLIASTNQPFVVIMNGFYRLQLKLSTAITGSGTLTPYVVPLCYTPAAPIGIYNTSLPTLTNGQAAINQTDANGRLIVSGTGGTFPVTESGTWTVQPGNTANSTPWLASITPSTGGGWSKAKYATQTTTVQTVKGSAGILGGYFISNTANSASSCVQVFDSTSATLGSTTPNMIYEIPANGAANVEFVNGVNMATGIQLAAATTCTGSTAPTSGLNITVYYK